MPDFDDAPTLALRFRQHAALCSSPLYAELMRAMADDWDAGGVVREICAGWEEAPSGSVVQLRLLAGLHRVVLRGDAPELAHFYRDLGGTASPGGAWPFARPVLTERVEELRAGLALAPQTNEVGRAAPLAVGLADALWRTGAQRVRLLEVGASAGLNLLVDRFAVGLDDGRWLGDPASRLALPDAVQGPVEPVPYEVVQRRGCDLSPVDASTDEGRLRLSSFVWPDHVDRFERLQAALRLARETPVRIEEGAASRWLEQVLAEAVDDDVLTVVWQSITRMYWPDEERRRVDAALDEAGSRLWALAHVAMEYGQESAAGAQLSVNVWRLGRPDGARTVLAAVADHGVPVRLSEGVRVDPVVCGRPVGRVRRGRTR